MLIDLARGSALLHAHAYAKAYCPGGFGGYDRLSINGTPTVPEREARKIRRALSGCKHGGNRQ
jgi:hypothetical protein